MNIRSFINLAVDNKFICDSVIHTKFDDLSLHLKIFTKTQILLTSINGIIERCIFNNNSPNPFALIVLLDNNYGKWHVKIPKNIQLDVLKVIKNA